jgi:hypothetical protein
LFRGGQGGTVISDQREAALWRMKTILSAIAILAGHQGVRQEAIKRHSGLKR